MRRTRHLSISRRKKNHGFSVFKTHYKLLLMLLAIILGLILGAALIRESENFVLTNVKSMLSQFLHQRSSSHFFKIFFNSFLSVLTLFCFAYLSGLFVLGAPLSIGIMIYRGLGFGVISGYLYSAFALQGVAFSLLILLPGYFISTFALLLACRESYTFSAMLFSTLTPAAKPYKLWEDFKIYNKRYVFIFIFIIMSSILDSIMSSVFMRFFSFS